MVERIHDYKPNKLKNLIISAIKNGSNNPKAIYHAINYCNPIGSLHSELSYLKEHGYILSKKIRGMSLYSLTESGEIEFINYGIPDVQPIKEYCTDVNNKTMHSRFISGEITHKEYDDYMARKRGFKCSSEVELKRRHEKNGTLPLKENKECGQYLGVYIAERILFNIFGGLKRMPYTNHGYDFICNKGYKIEVKSGCLRFNRQHINIYQQWNFHINKNNVADYFLLLAFDNREDLNPLHVWMIHKEDKINNKFMKEYIGFSVSNSKIGLLKMKDYNLENKLEKIVECCNSLRGES